MNDDKIVYWLENGRGNKYHLYKDCYYMGNCRPDARSGSIAEAKAAGRAEACKVCEERAARQVERGEDKPANRVYWRYGSDETVWHLYDTCPDLAGAAKEGMLCSGTVEAAINTGRSMVCPLCKKRYGECRTQADMQEDKAEPVKAPAVIIEPERKPAKDQEKQIVISQTMQERKPTEAPKAIQKKSPEAISSASKQGKPLVIRRTSWATAAITAICTALCVFVLCMYYYNDYYKDAITSAYSDGVRDEKSKVDDAYNNGYADGKAIADSDIKHAFEVGYENGRVAKSNSYVVYVSISGTKYHRKECSYLKSSSMPVDVTDALNAGYTACSRCNP